MRLSTSKKIFWQAIFKEKNPCLHFRRVCEPVRDLFSEDQRQICGNTRLHALSLLCRRETHRSCSREQSSDSMRRLSRRRPFFFSYRAPPVRRKAVLYVFIITIRKRFVKLGSGTLRKEAKRPPPLRRTAKALHTQRAQAKNGRPSRFSPAYVRIRPTSP